MTGEWQKTTVGALCDEGILHTQTGPFGSQLHSYDYVPSGIPVVPTEAIGRRRLVTEGIPQVTKETAARLARHRIQAGDILFARRGVQATGLSAIASQLHDGWLCGTGAILLRVMGGSVDPQFLSFFLSSDESVKWLKQHAVGAVMPNLNERVIRQLPLRLPPLLEQKAIVHILGSLDDKVELNRRMNQTLEAMAQALFKSWFIDPAQDALPKDWRESTIGEEVRVVGGSTPSTSRPEFWEGGTHYWATPKDLAPLTSPVLLDTERRITELGVQQISSGLLYSSRSSRT
jgi:type I restriction enzyme S subunit